jgi:hypothetical protein
MNYTRDLKPSALYFQSMIERCGFTGISSPTERVITQLAYSKSWADSAGAVS